MSKSDNSRYLRLGQLLEFILILTSAGTVYALGLVIKSPGLGLFSVVWAWILINWRLKRQNSGWRIFGWHRSQKWGRTLVLIFTVLGVLYGVIHLLKPVVTEWTGSPLDISLFQSLRGDFFSLLGGLFVVWTVGAFGEEMVFRGYILNRVAEILPSRVMGWIVGVVASSLFFGLGHVYQGWAGVILAAAAGCIYSAAYFLDRRCLWAPVLIHGLYDTVAFMVLFLNLD